MRRLQRQRMFKFPRPAVQRLIGTRIDEIQRCAVKNTTRGNKSIFGLLKRMCAAQKFQRGRIKGLSAERQAGNAGGLQILQPRRRCRDGIGFQRNFCIRRQPPAAVNISQKITDQLRRHKRGCAAAEKNGFDGSARAHGLGVFKRQKISRAPVGGLHITHRMNIKITIGADR